MARSAASLVLARFADGSHGRCPSDDMELAQALADDMGLTESIWWYAGVGLVICAGWRIVCRLMWVMWCDGGWME
ncbi:MAG: hypothetical protein V8R00_02670 [Coprococcus catus]